jgi:hypothetical protein
VNCGRSASAWAHKREHQPDGQRVNLLLRYLPLLAAILAGCGSSGPAGDHSVAGLNAAAQQLPVDLQHGRYDEACEAFTAKARASLAREPGGCAGDLRLTYAFLGGQLDRWFNRVLPRIQVQGDTALFDGKVQARYEDGRWRLEDDVW